MSTPEEQIEALKKKYIDENLNNEWYDSHSGTFLSGIGTSTIEACMARDETQHPSLQTSESLDDHCLILYVSRDDETLSKPEHYEGARLFYVNTGDINAL